MIHSYFFERISVRILSALGHGEDVRATIALVFSSTAPLPFLLLLVGATDNNGLIRALKVMDQRLHPDQVRDAISIVTRARDEFYELRSAIEDRRISYVQYEESLARLADDAYEKLLAAISQLLHDRMPSTVTEHATESVRPSLLRRAEDVARFVIYRTATTCLSASAALLHLLDRFPRKDRWRR